MCGQSGMFVTNHSSKQEIQVAKRLMILNILRGEHSAGLIDYCPSSKKGDEFNFWKDADGPLEFLSSSFPSLEEGRWKKHNPTLITTHCRHATKGALTVKNAHPFCHGNIIGMHNGTIKKDFKNSNKFETDSEAFFYNLSKEGLAKALEYIKDKDAAFAFVWVDLEYNTLNFIRNLRRPLNYCFMYNGKTTLFWSSDAEHLKLGINSSFDTKPCTTTSIFKPYIHYETSLDAKQIVFKETDYTQYEDSTFTFYTGGAYKSSAGESFSTSHGESSLIDVDVSTKTILERYKRLGRSVTSQYASDFDSEWKLYFSLTQLNHIKALRYTYEKEMEKEKVKDTSLNDSLPDHLKNVSTTTGSAVSSNYDKNSGKEEAQNYPFGPSFAQYCSKSRYLQLLSGVCGNCGGKVHIGDKLVWLSKTEYICPDCITDVVTDPNHWLFNGGGYDVNTQQRMFKDFRLINPTPLN